MNINYVITPKTERKLQQNALRIEAILPIERCSLKPRDDMARELLNTRPGHLGHFWQLFGYCTGSGKCEACPVATKVLAKEQKK